MNKQKRLGNTGAGLCPVPRLKERFKQMAVKFSGGRAADAGDLAGDYVQTEMLLWMYHPWAGPMVVEGGAFAESDH
jgi:hypothetical protein